MSTLAAAAITFAALHLLVSGTRLRDLLVGRIGNNPYRAAFSVASAFALGWLIWSYGKAVDPQVTAAYSLRWLAAVLMVPAVALMVLGLLTPGPTLAGAEGLLRRDAPARGIHRITRHPFLWGVAIWSAVHLAFNAGAAHAMFFGTFLLVSVAGTFSIDAKRARHFGADWERYRASTSNIPFAAILAGRNRFTWNEFGALRVAAILAAYLALAGAHGRLFGVAPF